MPLDWMDGRGAGEVKVRLGGFAVSRANSHFLILSAAPPPASRPSLVRTRVCAQRLALTPSLFMLAASGRAFRALASRNSAASPVARAAVASSSSSSPRTMATATAGCLPVEVSSQRDCACVRGGLVGQTEASRARA